MPTLAFEFARLMQARLWVLLEDGADSGGQEVPRALEGADHTRQRRL